MPAPLWQPGKAPYAEWLRTLTPEEKETHLNERKIRKSMKQAMKEVVEAQQAEWLARINNAMVSVIDKAEREGDAQALATVYDRIIGKPDSQVDVTSNGNTIQAPTIIFTAVELDEWKDSDKGD